MNIIPGSEKIVLVIKIIIFFFRHALPEAEENKQLLFINLEETLCVKNGEYFILVNFFLPVVSTRGQSIIQL